MTHAFTLLTVQHCEQMKRVVVDYSLIVMLTQSNNQYKFSTHVLPRVCCVNESLDGEDGENPT